MNIFLISDNVRDNAAVLDNKRAVKMVLETAQLLSNALRHFTGSAPYRATHINHPCSVWVCASSGNYSYTLDLFKALLAEYTRRYGKTHKCQELLPAFESALATLPAQQRTDFVNCTPYKDLPVFEAYRRTLADKWRNDKQLPVWG